MHEYVHLWSPNDDDGNHQKQQTLEPVSFTTLLVFILVSNPVHQYNVFLLASFSGE